MKQRAGKKCAGRRKSGYQVNTHQDYLHAAKKAFCETISLKMQQLRQVVPKGSNPALTGSLVEELVRGFIQDWIRPSLLMQGTFFPDAQKHVPSQTQRVAARSGMTDTHSLTQGLPRVQFFCCSRRRRAITNPTNPQLMP
jgi:hypothetical protein